ncbi:MAG: hypothetical protein RR406_04820 [Bacilli bacterium]
MKKSELRRIVNVVNTIRIEFSDYYDLMGNIKDVLIDYLPNAKYIQSSFTESVVNMILSSIRENEVVQFMDLMGLDDKLNTKYIINIAIIKGCVFIENIMEIK